MNIFQTVIDSVAANGADITDAGGVITITGLSRPIPKAGIVSARRVVVGEKPQVWTAAIPSSPSTSTTYQISVTGKSVVTGIIKTWTANYTTAASGTTQAILSAGLAASLAYTDAPFTISGSGTATLTLTAKSGTPNILVTSNLLTVANATVGLATAGTGVAISTAGALTGTGTAFDTQLTLGAGFYTANAAGTVSLTGYVGAVASATAATVYPSPSAALSVSGGSAANIFLIDNTGATIENTYAYANLPNVTLNLTNRYVVYEIDALDRLTVGNGARPDGILMKYVIYVNGGDADTFTVSGSYSFDSRLALACGLSSF